MSEIRATFDERKKEIVDFIEFIKYLESKENSTDEDGVSEFSMFFHPEAAGISLTFQRMINIMKSNLSLMIYNIIEFTVSNLIDNIYEEIRNNNLSYVDVNDSIKVLWRRSILKAANDPNASFTTFMKKNEEIINKIISCSTIDLRSRNTLPAGNLDGPNIKETLEKHGVRWNCSNYRPTVLEMFKTKRNDLAHGSVSFVDALRDSTITNIEANANVTVAFLEELMIMVDGFIQQQDYKVSIGI